MTASTPLRYAQTEEGYVFQLVDERQEKQTDKLLLISNSAEYNIVSVEKQIFKTAYKQIAGILGVIHLYSNHYVITIDSVSDHGEISLGKPTHKVESFSILPLNTKQKPDEDELKYIEILRSHLNNSTLFFSYHYDLTNTNANQNGNPLGFNDEFMWNYFVSSKLIEFAKTTSYATNFVLPVIYGYTKFVNYPFGQEPITFGLITRRSRFRAGTRYFRRGINREGNVANFNETEQFLITATNKVYSYLQIRGSVPIFWAEMNNLKYKPKLLLGPNDYLPARQHFDNCISRYGTNYLVNLVNQSGYEKPIKMGYEEAVTALNDPQIKYTYFDFHHECSKMRWDRVKLLLHHLAELGLSPEDYTLIQASSSGAEILKKQSHVVRTNCMDCLDRTNVVQSMLGRWVLQQQLKDEGLIDGAIEWKDLKHDLNLIFQSIWADNADYVSMAYSGTGALKTDYTRTGKRTKKGALNDLINSITRYVKNNYYDGLRQDGFDLFLGIVEPYEIRVSPFKDNRPPFYQAVPYMFTVGVFIILATLIWPKGSLTEYKNISFLSIMSLVSGFSMAFMIKNGIQYVNWPSLAKLDFLEKKEIVKDGKVEGYLVEQNKDYHKYNKHDKKQ